MSPAEVLKELKRERAMRARVYPDWIGKGRITRADADHRIAAIDAAIEIVAREAEAANPQGSML